jgi:hypothetical protein
VSVEASWQGLSPGLLMKSTCRLKGDTDRHYSCYASAAFLKKFVELYDGQLFLDNARSDF